MTISLETLAANLTLDVSGFTGGATKAADAAKEFFSGLTGGAQVAAVGFAATTAAVAAAGVALYQVGSDFAGAYDTIRIGTGKTGDALDGLKQSFKNVVTDVPTDFESASTAISSLNQRLNLTGQPLEDLSKQFLNLSRITKEDLGGSIQTITRVFGDWSIDDKSKAMDEMFRASQATGIGVNRLAEQVVQFGAPLRGLGFGFEESIAMMAKWEKEGVNQTNVMGAMKKAYGEFSKEFGERAPEEFRRFMTEISKAPSASAAAAMAIEKLGVRNGPDFAAAVTEGRFAYGDLVAQITGGSDTINKAAEDTEHFGEKWEKFVNGLKVTVEPVATAVFNGIGNALDLLQGPATAATDAVKIFYSAFTGQGVSVSDNVGSWAVKVANFGNAARTAFDAVKPIISDFADTVLPKLRAAWESAFGGIETAIGWLGDHQEILIGLSVALGVGAVAAVYALATALVTTLVPAVWSLAAGVIAATWPFLAIGIAITAVVAAVIWAYNHWQFFRNVVDGAGVVLLWIWNSVLMPIGSWIMGTLVPILANIIGKIAEFVSNIPGWIGNIPEALGAVVEFFENLPGTVAGFLAGLWTSISTWVLNAAAALPGLIAGWATAFFSWILGVIVALPGQLAFLDGFIIGWVFGMAARLSENINGWVGSFFSWVLGVIVALPGQLLGIVEGIWAWVAQTAAEMPGRLSAWWDQFSAWAYGLAVSFGFWLIQTSQTMWNWIAATAAALPGNIAGWLNSFRDWAYNLAVSFGYWLIGATNSVRDWILGVPGAVAGAIGGMLSVGRSIVEGIWNGISGAGGWLMDRIRGFASGIVSGFMAAIKGGSPAMELVPVGDSIMQGIGLGLTRGAKGLHNTIADVSKGAINAFQVQMSGYGLVDAARELLAHLQSGGDFFEEMSFDGESAAYADWNDKLSDLFWAQHPGGAAAGWDFGRGDWEAAAGISFASGLVNSGGQSGGAATVEFSGDVDSAFASAFQKLVRTGQIQIKAA